MAEATTRVFNHLPTFEIMGVAKGYDLGGMKRHFAEIMGVTAATAWQEKILLE